MPDQRQPGAQFPGATSALPATGTHEVDADGADVALCVGVIREPEQQARLAHARVANEQELEQVIAAEVRTNRTFRHAQRPAKPARTP